MLSPWVLPNALRSEIFKKCERFLKEYDDMFDVQQKLWETWGRPSA